MNIAIGELSRRSEVKIPTIRYYERIGLLSKPSRSEGGQRRYAGDAIQRLTFIRHSRELGFEIEDIRQLLGLAARPQDSCHEVDSIARRHLAEIDERIAALNSLRDELARMVRECDHGRISECRIVETIGDHTHCAADHTRSETRVQRRGAPRG